jgi:NTE family protein
VSINQVLARQKDIQFASRADSHIARQKQIHRLRHIITELGKELPTAKAAHADIKELLAWGCATRMHIAHLVAPRIEGEDQYKDIDFSAKGIAQRREAGYEDTLRMIERSPWQQACDPIEGVIEYH